MKGEKAGKNQDPPAVPKSLSPRITRLAQVFNNFSHLPQRCWRKPQNRPNSGRKNCHNSNLKITNCTRHSKTGRKKSVENSVEKVEFHPENRLVGWNFSLFPPGFQHVEKKDPVYNGYTGRNVENFCPAGRRGLRRGGAAKTGKKPGRAPAQRREKQRKNAPGYSKEGRPVLYFNLCNHTNKTSREDVQTK